MEADLVGKAEAELDSKKLGRRLVFFPVPLQGHINPVIQLANVFHSKGFSITIIHTEFNSLDQSKYPDFTFHLIPDGLLEHEVSTSDVTVLLAKLNINCANPLRQCLDRLLQDKGEPVACLITDTIWYFTQELADSFNLPRIAFRTTSICSFLAFYSLPIFRKLGYLPKQDSQLEVEVPEFPPLRVKDIPAIKSRDPENVFSLISCMMEKTKAASGLIFNSFEELEQQELTKVGEEFRIPTFAIGPLHKYFPASSSSLMEQDRSAICWLDKQAPKSVIYVSFGSIAEMDETQLSEVAWGIANSLQPFLWVVRPGLVQNSSGLENLLPNGFLEAVNGRGYIVNWAPQQEVLAHPAVGAFWTHSGWNSTLESICEGVPMICSPFFGDQLVNSRFANDVWKIGLRLEEGLKKGEIERAIKRLMDEKESEEIRMRVSSYKEKINACVKEGGSSHQSVQSFIDYILSI
ncbi:OLC1v1026669C1 [Oldenlandia corymbosa var. corymbosa]|uniref:OLC1v1026669C1 n=1 Tax=Oldenlandia corymbosa var. corymbosa TaxID=529605 RepID=A0AAV1C865_OLDCO|nr:OLC1v1026669C1 [Oldenlandia corymbosa var. corymbosa]